jgi:hypothetical protein
VRYYGSPYGPGDVVGCGLDYRSKEIFFTLNGEYLGVAFKVGEEGGEEGGGEGGGAKAPLYPTVGIDSLHPVQLNFGEEPFVFDLQAYMGGGTGPK